MRWGSTAAKSVLQEFNEIEVNENVMWCGVYIGVQDNEEEEQIVSTVSSGDEEAFCQFVDEVDNGNIGTRHPITINMDGTEMYKSTAVRYWS